MASETVTPAAQTLILTQQTPNINYDYKIEPSTLELNLSLPPSVSGETGGYQPLNLGWGHQDFDSSGKPQSLSLFWKGRIVSEKHHEPERSYEKPLFKESKDFSNLKEIPERVVPTRGQTGPNVNAPLTPLMPHIKRNKDNHLDKFLEGKTLHNKTLFRRIGRKGARFGEGIDSDEGLLKKWEESNKTTS